MTKIFKQLARHWAVCLVVFALLFVQAYCDLSLPDYTSRIVDTGIQQGGIESPLPETIRQSTLDALTLLMSEEDADALQNAYGYYLQDDGVLKLRTDLTDDERNALEDAVTTPDIVLYMAAAQAANAPAGQDTMGMTGLADMQAASSESTTTDSETVTPTAEDLDTVCAQFAAMSQMPGFTREAVQQQLAELLPVELGVQRSPQAVVKLFQPLKGRGDPPGRDILHRCQLCKDLQRIHPHRTPLLFPVVPLVPLCHS